MSDLEFDLRGNGLPAVVRNRWAESDIVGRSDVVGLVKAGVDDVAASAVSEPMHDRAHLDRMALFVPASGEKWFDVTNNVRPASTTAISAPR
jgi:hypothetical protein